MRSSKKKVVVWILDPIKVPIFLKQCRPTFGRTKKLGRIFDTFHPFLKRAYKDFKRILQTGRKISAVTILLFLILNTIWQFSYLINDPGDSIRLADHSAPDLRYSMYIVFDSRQSLRFVLLMFSFNPILRNYQTLIILKTLRNNS
jgi:hypothetical protein